MHFDSLFTFRFHRRASRQGREPQDEVSVLRETKCIFSAIRLAIIYYNVRITWNA
jgi:hypothetical protein